MFYSILVVAAVGGILFGVNRWQKLPEEERAAFAKKGSLYGAAAIVLALVLAGKAHWLMGILAGLLALLGRAAQFAQYVPMFKKFMGAAQSGEAQANSGGSSTNSQGSSSLQTKPELSRQDAAEILGVDPNASDDDIKAAHKRLMQKLHPDRGGSDALAKQINLAKDVLLKS